VETYAETFPFEYDETLAKELGPYLETVPLSAQLEPLVETHRGQPVRTIDFLVRVNQHVQSLVEYVVRLEPGIQTCEETLTLKRGSCRDSAWLLVQLFRHLGLAARFASGYLIQLTADVKSLDGPSGPTADFTDLHAWTEVYLPGAGWVGLDPTSGLLCGEGHIPLACAADPTSAAPISGSFDPGDAECETSFDFAMSVRRVHEDPRVTKPYTDAQWDEIEALGHRIDEVLKAGDVRLTMGGEPTFVAIDDRDAEEWNTAALGAKKRERAGELLRRLRDRFAPQGFLHFGQGKWYPGESLPRWALACHWRKDGVPAWSNAGLIAADDHDYGVRPDDAKRFATSLAGQLGVDSGFLAAGYEDALYYLWRERRLPLNVDPLKSNLDDPEERARLAKVFDRGLNRVVGFALPLRRGKDGWQSGPWHLRRDHLYLHPGDSPMGYRLPLEALPWEPAGVRQEVLEFDPSVPRGPLARGLVFPSPLAGEGGRASRPGEGWGVTSVGASPLSPGPSPSRGEGRSTDTVVRTALCVEARDGRLMVFFPPLAALEDYLALVAAVETTAARLGMPVQIEGYEPPSDSRLSHFKITPDPGVIEVNVQPAASWKELVHNTTVLYDEAHQTRLAAEKFMMDGRHTGTGGGNHVVIGGPTTLDSPVLRRPDLLRSLVGYWHNHPSLSYLFSGMFVGPTSQAPRIDEARNDSIYELELAFKEVSAGGQVTPWLVDRVFRHLLTDLTGNTHRAEFCIDKLFSPDSPSGRHGLVE
ncbi:MAG TPA: transglutaminase family protein, partial [Gemmataceae bacterium]|nr:transglutaminase family protein [Gemmataceae bacterium]